MVIGSKGTAVATASAVAIGGAYLYAKMSGKNNREEVPAVFADEQLGPKIKAILNKHVDGMLKESIIKIARQLDFWSKQGLSETEMLELTERLVSTATVLSADFQVPKVRFGRTELQMPIVTCGGMRFQQTWLPDFLPIAPRPAQVLQSPSQENLMRTIQFCLAKGINHFETARFYGTSELQFAEALHTLMKEGKVKREDFIFQTKVPIKENRQEFEKMLDQSWAHLGEKLGYFDLFAFHCLSRNEDVEWALSDADDMPMAAVLKMQREGKIKHIGFSTHGTAANIRKLIESNKFAFCNLHAHFFGSYHGEGTPDSRGGHGNMAAVKRARELDMGVFQISGVDKAGMLYCPSATLAKLLGPKMDPIAFGLLENWEKIGIHTASIGFGNPADVEESLAAARVYAGGAYHADLDAAEKRVRDHMESTIGNDWESHMVGIPSCDNPVTNGVAIGHMVWLHNLMASFGMYDFCRARYRQLEKIGWDHKKDYKENYKKHITSGNMGRSHCTKTDYSEALKDHANPEVIKAKVAEVDGWLGNAKPPKDRESKGWAQAYDLRVWENFPGYEPSIPEVVLQNLSFGWLGAGGGPNHKTLQYADRIRQALQED